MIPSEARIFHIDDSEFARIKVAEAANNIGAIVVANADSFEEAKEVIKILEELGVNVVLTDENLSPDRPYEGRYIYDIVRAANPEVHILSVSGSVGMSRDLRIPHVPDKGVDPTMLKAAIEAL